jgi:3-methyl-2-oxobutanoate hydroxymethyltransferase
VGETLRPPRHARAYGDLARLRREMGAARVAALSAFREDVERGGYPGPEEARGMEPRELAALRERLPGAAGAG